jgi:hypothetical protein
MNEGKRHRWHRDNKTGATIISTAVVRSRARRRRFCNCLEGGICDAVQHALDNSGIHPLREEKVSF